VHLLEQPNFQTSDEQCFETITVPAITASSEWCLKFVRLGSPRKGGGCRNEVKVFVSQTPGRMDSSQYEESGHYHSLGQRCRLVIVCLEK
jgi:hypothetical protein